MTRPLVPADMPPLSSLIATCGPDCSLCPAWIATQSGDEAALAKMADEWTQSLGRPYTPADIACDGCRVDSTRRCGFCATCEIRNCALVRGNPTCAHCDDYPCVRTEALPNREALATLRRQIGRE